MNHALPPHRILAMALLTSGEELRPREGQFLGGIAFDDRPLTPKQARWLEILLERHGCPPPAETVTYAGRA